MKAHFYFFFKFNLELSASFGRYSTVSFVRCNGGLFRADVTFNFSITYRSPALSGNFTPTINCSYIVPSQNINNKR